MRIPPHKGQGVVAVLGDSIGRSLDAGMIEFARRRGWGYVLAAHNGCNLSGLHNTKGKVRTPWVDACVKQTPGRIRQVLDEYRPTLVIAVSRWEATTYLGPDGHVRAPLSAQWTADVHDGLRRFAETVTATGAVLAVFQVLPQGPTFPDCPNHPGTPGCTPAAQPTADATNAIYRRISEEVPGLTLLPVDEICPDLRCPVTVDGAPLKQDGVHVTPDGARWMLRRLEPSLPGAR